MIHKIFHVLTFLLLIACMGILVFIAKINTKMNFSTEFYPNKQPYIEVSYTESKKYEANKFITRFRLEIRDKNKETLMKKMNERRNVIFETAKALDVFQSNIEQNSLDIRKEWNYEKGKRDLAGYVATQTFEVFFNNKSNAAQLMGLLSLEKDIEVEQTLALLSDADSIQSEVIKAAGAKVLEKAKNYAESVGAKTGKILFIGADGDGVKYNRVYGSRSISRKAFLTNSSMDTYNIDENMIVDSVEVSASMRIMLEIK